MTLTFVFKLLRLNNVKSSFLTFCIESLSGLATARLLCPPIARSLLGFPSYLLAWSFLVIWGPCEGSVGNTVVP